LTLRKVLIGFKQGFLVDDKSFSELLGAFAGDGWMSKGSSGISLFITGNPKDEREYYDKRISVLFKKTFKIKVLPREFPYWGTYGICVGKRFVTKEFISAGMTVGKKCNTVKVPATTIANPKLYAPFICGLFDTDGCIYFKKSYNKNASKWQKANHHIPIIMIGTVSKNLATDSLKVLHFLGLKFSIRIMKPYNGNYPTYRLELEGKAKAKEFFRKIKPKNKRHIDKFELWLSQGFY